MRLNFFAAFDSSQHGSRGRPVPTHAIETSSSTGGAADQASAKYMPSAGAEILFREHVYVRAENFFSNFLICGAEKIFCNYEFESLENNNAIVFHDYAYIKKNISRFSILFYLYYYYILIS